ncbi:MAG: SAM-dependent methyltransferase [Burkholderiales bacterium PBB1]|nr:MAG: SAM-dependent methyltransferase [Burkholderiales bacterium PBB1]
MSVFDLYAACYDLLYRDKNYRAEADYVAALVRQSRPGATDVLELGCGTGGHAVELAGKSLRVHGVDLSPAMVERALARRSAAGSGLAAALRFEQGDVRCFRAGRTFDAVISLFHVMSYQATTPELLAAMATARAHLEPGGVFVFDSWYGPAVLSDRPRCVIKEVRDDRVSIVRRTTPTMQVNANLVDVHFDIEITAIESGEQRRVAEDHRMRYLFVPEVDHLLGASGFELVATRAWMSQAEPDDRSWYACFEARAL